MVLKPVDRVCNASDFMTYHLSVMLVGPYVTCTYVIWVRPVTSA